MPHVAARTASRDVAAGWYQRWQSLDQTDNLAEASREIVKILGICGGITMVEESQSYSQPDRRGVDQHQLLRQHICLQLAAHGHHCDLKTDRSILSVADNLLQSYSQQRRLLADYRCPADQRIQNFINEYYKRNNIDADITLPGNTFALLQEGLAREMSVPHDKDSYSSELLTSYRVKQGVLHNPKNDRRTTKGVFHIVEGGLPVPGDKREVPVYAHYKLLQAALNPPKESLLIPITSTADNPVHMWVSLLMRPTVRPEVANVLPAKSLEIRMFAPGGLVANLDFVETIFGNGGDPFLPENDAALDIEHWTGHSGCIILAPHLTKLKKTDLGLPHYKDATDRQRKDGMCWESEDELYNNGDAFKVVCRDMQGVVVTIIADNYFGYSKKEVKSQISYSSNLFGGSEEEHAGGALAFPRFNLSEMYMPGRDHIVGNNNYENLCQQMADQIDQQPEGYSIDRNYNDIIYIPENSKIDIQTMSVSWLIGAKQNQIPLKVSKIYLYPSGFYVQLKRHPHAPSWRLIGTDPDATFCHKPSTVSGGGKSEISKSIQDLMLSGPVYVKDFDKDLDTVEEIFTYDYSTRFKDSSIEDERGLLDPSRSLGSIIKMLTPSTAEYTNEFNRWLETIPNHILALVYMIKRFYKPEWGDDWQSHFSVDEVNGLPGHELKYHGRNLEASYLRVGTKTDGTWRIFKLRQDFVAAAKLQMEDDISASTIVPTHYVKGLNQHDAKQQSIKLLTNCERFLFQRPDDAVHRGIDKQTEADLAGDNNFISNFEPLENNVARKMYNDVVNFERFTRPMQKFIRSLALSDQQGYFVSSDAPRLVDGKPTLNMRYLQKRPDEAKTIEKYLAFTSTRLARGLSAKDPVYFPVHAVLQGRRNNPQEKAKGIRPLAVYNPIHYQALPELFMDLISSLTGKSPSTTGAGSEGALTKGPFNSMPATADLNTALVTFILCGHDGFSSAAGYIGHQRRIDHDVSMLIPEIWCRIPVAERQPGFLIENGYFEKLDDFEYNNKQIRASRLGYRMTDKFVRDYFGKIFDNPMIVFDEVMLKPELQDMHAYVDGIENIVEAHQRVAQGYIADGSIDHACPPLKALLYIMAEGNYQGMDINHPEIRSQFTRESLLNSDWYKQRLMIKQQRDVDLWKLNKSYIEQKLQETPDDEVKIKQSLGDQLAESERMIEVVSDHVYLERLDGTQGADWIVLEN